MAKRVKRHCGTQCAAADSEHDKIFELLAHVLCRFENVRYDFVLIIGEFRPTHKELVLAAVFGYIAVSLACKRFEFIELFGGKTFFAEIFVRRVGVVYAKAQSLFAFVVEIHKTNSSDLEMISNILSQFKKKCNNSSAKFTCARVLFFETEVFSEESVLRMP